jgi:HSP20 family protein
MLPSLSTDITEDDTTITVQVDLPGFAKDDIDVTIRNNVLSIKARRQRSEELHKHYQHRIERSFGSVQRSIAVPHDADISSVETSYRDGVLTGEHKMHSCGV